MQGEVSSKQRPLNSLLETVLDFDTASKPAPVMDEEAHKVGVRMPERGAHSFLAAASHACCGDCRARPHAHVRRTHTQTHAPCTHHAQPHHAPTTRPPRAHTTRPHHAPTTRPPRLHTTRPPRTHHIHTMPMSMSISMYHIHVPCPCTMPKYHVHTPGWRVPASRQTIEDIIKGRIKD
eukprot:1042230-Prymnesium_polylepis.1